MKKTFLFFVMVALTIGCQTPKKHYKVAIFSPMVHQSLVSMINGFKEGMREHGWQDGINIDFIDVNASGNWNEMPRMLEGIYDEKPDLVFVVTTPAAEQASKLCRKSKIPTIYGAVTDPLSSNIIDSFEKSEFPITGVTDRYPTKDQSEFFASFFKDIKSTTCAILYTPSEKNSQILSAETEKYLNEIGVHSERVAVENVKDLDKKVENIITSYSAIIVNGDNTIVDRLSVVANLCRKNAKPLFVGDPLSVGNGAIGSLGPDYFSMGKDASQKADLVLKGSFAGIIANSNPTKFTRVINTKVANEIGFKIPLKVWEASNQWQSINN
jgi:putative tryptophan/tyrosine transport system substrate-binding protein